MSVYSDKNYQRDCQNYFRICKKQVFRTTRLHCYAASHVYDSYTKTHLAYFGFNLKVPSSGGGGGSGGHFL